MAKDYGGGSPKLHQLESKRRRLTWILAVTGLCVLFYVLGAWQNTTPASSSDATSSNNVSKLERCINNAAISTAVRSGSSPLDFRAHHQLLLNETAASLAAVRFPACGLEYSEYTPCQDPDRARKFNKKMLMYRERHCPVKPGEQLRCLVPAPPKYKNPFKWPQSRDYAWYDNIPHRELSIEKAVQNWIQVEGDRFRFPGGGTMFPRGADAYIDDINALIPLTDGSIRTAIDTGCGETRSKSVKTR